MTKIQDIKSNILKRFEYIEFQLMWEGSVGRKKLQEQFAISMQQATKDLNAYMDACPENMFYDPRQKSYVPSRSFSPVLTKGQASEYLMHLEMLRQGYRAENEIWVSSIPNFDTVSVHSRKVNPPTLVSILSAIRDQTCLKARYISLSSENTDFRTLKPHAIASDGHRWHMRAFDFENERYSDFVISRLETPEPVETPNVDMPTDRVWETSVEIILQADPSLSQKQQKQLEYEYDMEGGRIHFEVKQAMLFYYLRHYGFDPLALKDNAQRNESSFHLKIVNLKGIQECLGRRR